MVRGQRARRHVAELGRIRLRVHLRRPAAWFKQVGINISVLMPGEPNCLYHSESQQEDFLVLFGEAKLLVEGEERAVRQWDFIHSPAGTVHVFVGAGDGPCAILMVGARTQDEQLLYPVSELAARYGASAEEETLLRRARPTRGSSGRGAKGRRTGISFPGPDRRATLRPAGRCTPARPPRS